MKNYNKYPKNKIFNLFKLDGKTSKSPNSWLWCTFKSDRLRDEYNKRLKLDNQSDISKILAKNLYCGKSTIERHLTKLKKSDKSCSLPIKVVDALGEFLCKEDNNLKKMINENIGILFFKNRLTKPVNAIKNMSLELAEFIGAFVADGYFCGSSNYYYIKITEGHEEPLKYIQEKISKLFNFKTRIIYVEEEHCWNLWIKNKVICRYFERIFGFIPGKKAATVSMPKIIRKSKFSVQKAFVRGVFSFDGTIKTTGNAAFTTRSYPLMQDITKVLRKDKISFKISYNKNKDAWCLESSCGRDKKALKKWKGYFLGCTLKHKRILFFLGELKIVNFNELEKLFPIHHHNKIRFIEIYNTIKHLKRAEIKEIVKELKIKNVDIAITTFYKYLYILYYADLIGKEFKTIKTNKNGYKTVTYYIK